MLCLPKYHAPRIPRPTEHYLDMMPVSTHTSRVMTGYARATRLNKCQMLNHATTPRTKPATINSSSQNDSDVARNDVMMHEPTIPLNLLQDH